MCPVQRVQVLKAAGAVMLVWGLLRNKLDAVSSRAEALPGVARVWSQLLPGP